MGEKREWAALDVDSASRQKEGPRDFEEAGGSFERPVAQHQYSFFFFLLFPFSGFERRNDTTMMRVRRSAFFAAAAVLCVFAAGYVEGSSSVTQLPPDWVHTEPLNMPIKTLMGPGPSTAYPRILEAAKQPLVGHLHPEFVKLMSDVQDQLRYTFQTESKYTIAISGTGHAAMEAAVANFVEPDDHVLVGVNGIWGERMCDLVQRYLGVPVRMVKPGGEVFTTEEIEAELKRDERIKLVFLTHGESSTGTLQPIEGIGDLVHSHGALFFLDTVCTLGCVPFNVGSQGIDITYSGSQKCLGAPPGSSPLTVSQGAMEKLRSRKQPPFTYYFDLNLLGEYWGFNDNPRWYHHTGMVTNMYTLREALSILQEEGLEKAWDRHRQAAERLWAGLEALGLELFVENPELRLPTVTTVKVPEGVDWKDVSGHMMSKYKIEISGGLGPTAGKVWRIGIMGYNAGPQQVNRLLQALKDALDLYKPKAEL